MKTLACPSRPTAMGQHDLPLFSQGQAGCGRGLLGLQYGDPRTCNEASPGVFCNHDPHEKKGNESSSNGAQGASGVSSSFFFPRASEEPVEMPDGEAAAEAGIGIELTTRHGNRPRGLQF